ncbi:uncharacterized protein [Amphiura filiformis]|uniref:uncharacterized protein isoform X2 n=1 Tax=Amphiura filiformis TaxID=82378 RepID=UPI003B2256BC
MTNTSTKRSVLTFAGVCMLGYGIILVYIGHIYYTLPLASGSAVLERATPLWAGIILIMCGARNVTFFSGTLRSSSESCCGPGCFQAVLINLVALLAGLACIGVPIWTSWEKLTERPTPDPGLDKEPELVYLITILFSGVVIVIASISGIFVGFLPSSGSSSRTPPPSIDLSSL